MKRKRGSNGKRDRGENRGRKIRMGRGMSCGTVEGWGEGGINGG
jgi:hypothetical protein